MNTQVGQTIGNSRLERVLGRGFLGESYLARGTADGTQLVVKLLHEHLTGSGAVREKFHNLMRTVAGLKDRNIVPVRDFGEAYGRYFITMPFYPDGSLRGLLQRYQTELPVARAVSIMRQTADALAAAHSSGLVHRDLKPENILLTRREGGPGFAGALAQVADFSLTQLAEVGVTIGGNVAFGSFPYLSPEHCKGSGLTAQSDIYSFGIVLYESITGGPPFQVKTLGDALNKHLSGEVPRPRAIVPTLPVGLEEIALRCLAKDPAHRYQTAREVAVALSGIAIPGEIEINVDKPRVDPVPSQAHPSIVVKLKQPGSAPVEPPPSGGAASPPPPSKWVIKVDPALGADPVPPPVVPPPAHHPSPVGETVVGPPPTPAGGGGGQRWKVNLNAPSSDSPIDQTAIEPRPPSGGGQPSLEDSFVPESRGKAQPAPAPKPKPSRPGKTSRAVMVVVDPSSLTLTPGQPAMIRVTIANTSRRVEHFSVRVAGVRGPGGSPERWVELPRERVQLIPEGRATIPIKVLVPRTSDSAAGDYEVEVSAVGEVSQEVGTVVMTWTVLPYFETALTVTPARVRAWRSGKFSIGLVNEGNALVRCSLSATDDDRALRYQFSQPEVTLGNGVAATVGLRATGRLRPIGSLENRTCNVRIDRMDSGVAGAPEFKTARAQFAHRAVIPTWLLPVTVALTLAVYGLWPRTNFAIEVTPPNLAATVDFRTRVVGVVRNQKGEAVPNRPVKWTVQDSSVVQVAGIVGDTITLFPRRVGTTTLTASASRAPAAHVQISVSIAAVESVILSPQGLSLAIGETRRLTPTITDASGKRIGRDVNWFSSDQSVATVGNGEVTAKAAGRAVITAQVEAKSATANIIVRADSVGVVAGGVATEDCLGYEPSLLQLKKENPNGWVVRHQGQALLRLDQKGEGEQAIKVARRYKQHCYVGRRNGRPDSTLFYVEYWKGRSDMKYEQIKKEECRSYNPADLQVANVGTDWEVQVAGALLLRAASKSDAERIRDIAAQHTALCQIGQKNKRPNHRLYLVQYWK